jgi:hypothetical protein
MNFLLYVLLFVIFSPKFFMILGGRRAASVTMTDILFHALLFALALYVVGYFTRTYGVFEGFASPIEMLNMIQKYRDDLTKLNNDNPYPKWTGDRASYSAAYTQRNAKYTEGLNKLQNDLMNTAVKTPKDALQWWFYNTFVFWDWKRGVSLPDIRKKLIAQKINTKTYYRNYPPNHPFTNKPLITVDQMKSVMDSNIKSLPAK